MRLGQDSAEQIRRHEVARALKKIDLSREKEEVIELLSRSLVSRLLHGPISNVMARAEVEISFGNRRSMYVSCELEREVEPNHPGRSSTIELARTGSFTSHASFISGATKSPTTLHDPAERRAEQATGPTAFERRLAAGPRSRGRVPTSLVSSALTAKRVGKRVSKVDVSIWHRPTSPPNAPVSSTH